VQSIGNLIAASVPRKGIFVFRVLVFVVRRSHSAESVSSSFWGYSNDIFFLYFKIETAAGMGADESRPSQEEPREVPWILGCTPDRLCCCRGAGKNETTTRNNPSPALAAASRYRHVTKINITSVSSNPSGRDSSLSCGSSFAESQDLNPSVDGDPDGIIFSLLNYHHQNQTPADRARHKKLRATVRSLFQLGMEESNYAVDGVPCRILCRLLRQDVKVQAKLRSFYINEERDPVACFEIVTSSLTQLASSSAPKHSLRLSLDVFALLLDVGRVSDQPMLHDCPLEEHRPPTLAAAGGSGSGGGSGGGGGRGGSGGGAVLGDSIVPPAAGFDDHTERYEIPAGSLRKHELGEGNASA
jgi:hypothetical protein